MKIVPPRPNNQPIMRIRWLIAFAAAATMIVVALWIPRPAHGEETAACDYQRLDGQVLEAADKDLDETGNPEFEQRTKVTVGCTLRVSGRVEQDSMWLVDTELTGGQMNLTWEFVSAKTQEKITRIGTPQELPLVDGQLSLEGWVPDSTWPKNGELLNRRWKFRLVAINVMSEGQIGEVTVHKGITVDPHTLTLEEEIARSINGASRFQLQVIGRAKEALQEGFPELAATILKTVGDVKEAEKEANDRRWLKWVLLGSGLVGGVVLACLSSLIRKGWKWLMRARPPESSGGGGVRDFGLRRSG